MSEFEQKMARHERSQKWAFGVLIACIVVYGACDIALILHKHGVL